MEASELGGIGCLVLVVASFAIAAIIVLIQSGWFGIIVAGFLALVIVSVAVGCYQGWQETRNK